MNFDPEMTSLKTKTISSGDGLLFHCRYGAGPAMDVLREDGALETTVKRVLLQAAKQTVKAYLEMLKTVPNSRNTQSSLLLSEEDITMKLLVDESLIEQANVVLRFNHMLLPSTQLDQPFASVQSLCAGSASTSIKVFANLPPRDMDIRNLIIRYTFIVINATFSSLIIYINFTATAITEIRKVVFLYRVRPYF